MTRWSIVAGLGMLVLPAGLYADPPARLGLPDAPEVEIVVPGLPNSGVPAAATPSAAQPTPGVLMPGAAAPSGPTEAPLPRPAMADDPSVQTARTTDPTTGQVYNGYPVSYPSIPGSMVMTGDGTPVGRSAPAGWVSEGTPVPQGDVVYGSGPCCGPLNQYTQCGSGRCRTGQCGSDACGNPLTDHLSLFLGLDGAHEPLDLGINARMGWRTHLNWGLPIVEDWGLGLHLGAAYNDSNNAVRVLRAFNISQDIQQYFVTAGVFQRTDSGFNWELAFDLRFDDYYEHFSTSQWRGLVSYNLSDTNEVGVWGALRDHSDRADFFGIPFTARPVNQINLFWRHIWDHQIVTGFWIGWAEEHGRFNPILPAEPIARDPFNFGAEVFIPLSERLAIYGDANFLTPNDTGTVTATLGFAYFPAGRTYNQPRGRFSPLLPTVNNTTMPLDVQR